jgi:DNA-formamidopyrimidine glycosylase
LYRRFVLPESPELAVSRDRLRQILAGRHIISLNVGPSGRFLKKAPEGYDRVLKKLSGGSAKVEEIHTKGKFMWWSLSFPDDMELWYMFSTYGMSGGWEVNRSKHTAFSVVASDHINLFFNDQRRFGTIKFVRGKKELERKLATLGPCVLNDEITRETFEKKLLRKSKAPICEVLMDQSCVSGVGNYLRAEILYASRLNPWKKVGDLTSSEWDLLHKETLGLTLQSYKSQGASLYTWKNVDGEQGRTQFEFKVYGLEQDPLGQKILREEDANKRTIHWCPEVQK